MYGYKPEWRQNGRFNMFDLDWLMLAAPAHVGLLRREHCLNVHLRRPEYHTHVQSSSISARRISGPCRDAVDGPLQSAKLQPRSWTQNMLHW